MDKPQILPKQHTLRVAEYMRSMSMEQGLPVYHNACSKKNTSAVIRFYPCYTKESVFYQR